MAKEGLKSIADMRRDYAERGLSEADAGDDPIALFGRWFDEATATNPGEVYEPNAMTLATVDAGGAADARVVLLKNYDGAGFVFFTNYHSLKARQLEANSRAALVWHWPWLERQVRARGTVERVSREISEQYFATRPRGSQLGAWVSDQSQPMTREQMTQRLAELERKFDGKDVPCPPHWGGYRLIPESIEFWAGRENRLHDRLLFEREVARWKRTRLGP